MKVGILVKKEKGKVKSDLVIRWLGDEVRRRRGEGAR